jgi:hypothetical protein
MTVFDHKKRIDIHYAHNQPGRTMVRPRLYGRNFLPALYPLPFHNDYSILERNAFVHSDWYDFLFFLV